MKKSTRFWIAGIVTVFVIAAVIVGTVARGKPDNKGSVNRDTDNEDEQSDHSYDGNGLTVNEKEDSTIQNIDLPSSWEENTNSENDSKQEVTDSTDSTDSDVSQSDILEGQSWTKPR